MKTFLRVVVKEVTYPKVGLLLKKGDRVLTSDTKVNDDGETVVTVFRKYWFEVPVSIFSESDTCVFTNS